MTDLRQKIISEFRSSYHFRQRCEQRSFNQEDITKIVLQGRMTVQADGVLRFALGKSKVVVDRKSLVLITAFIHKSPTRQKRRKYRKIKSEK